jgi:hypothetical protein
VSDYSFEFDRLKSSYCPICKQKYYTDNRAVVKYGKKVFWKYFRGKKLYSISVEKETKENLDFQLSNVINCFQNCKLEKILDMPEEIERWIFNKAIYSELQMKIFDFGIGNTMIIKANMKMSKTKQLKEFINKYSDA